MKYRVTNTTGKALPVRVEGKEIVLQPGVQDIDVSERTARRLGRFGTLRFAPGEEAKVRPAPSAEVARERVSRKPEPAKPQATAETESPAQAE